MKNIITFSRRTDPALHIEWVIDKIKRGGTRLNRGKGGMVEEKISPESPWLSSRPLGEKYFKKSAEDLEMDLFNIKAK